MRNWFGAPVRASNAAIAMNTIQSKRFPRKTLLIASAVGCVAVLAIAINPRGFGRLDLWAAVICVAVAIVVDIIVVPLAIWRFLLNESLRTKANALCIAFGCIFVLLAVLQLAT
jgi:L-asparagine transporter-like permease